MGADSMGSRNMQSARCVVVFGYEVRNPTNLFYAFSGKKQRHSNHLHNTEALQHESLKGWRLAGEALRRRVIKNRRFYDARLNGKLLLEGLGQLPSHGGKAEESECTVFSSGRSKLLNTTAKQHRRNTLCPLSSLSKTEEGKKSRTPHFSKALKVKMICWLEIYLNERNPANGTGCRWKWQMESFKVCFSAWKKIIFLISLCFFSFGRQCSAQSPSLQLAVPALWQMILSRVRPTALENSQPEGVLELLTSWVHHSADPRARGSIPWPKGLCWMGAETLSLRLPRISVLRIPTGLNQAVWESIQKRINLFPSIFRHKQLQEFTTAI